MNNKTDHTLQSHRMSSAQAPVRNQPYRLIWFQHFHKAAGTSIVNLAKVNGETLYPKHDNGNPLDNNGQIIPLWNFDDATLTQFIDGCEKMGITFVANEWGAVNFELLAADPRVLLVTCIREPLQRFISNFYFDYWSGYTDCEALEQYLGSGKCFTMLNYYCRMLSRHDSGDCIIDIEQFETARKALSQFDHCVVLEHRRPFLRLRQSLGWHDATVNIHDNKSSHLNRRVLKLILKGEVNLLWRRIKQPKQQPKATFVQLFEQGNYWDHCLYYWVKNTLNSQASISRAISSLKEYSNFSSGEVRY